jgi:hypothetical protein
LNPKKLGKSNMKKKALDLSAISENEEEEEGAESHSSFNSSFYDNLDVNVST